MIFTGVIILQKKIFRSICFTVLASMIFFVVTVLCIAYKFYLDEAETELKTIVALITKADYSDEEIVEILESSVDYDIRYTRVDKDGNVLFDNNYDASRLDNHIDRQEISEALNNGKGASTRRSTTAGTVNYYVAVSDGESVIRLSRDVRGMLSLFLGVVPVVICIAGIVMIVATLVSMKLSESAIRPIQKLVTNLDVLNEEQQYDVEYEELEPIVEAMKRLSARLSKYISRLKTEKETITLITENMVEGMIILDEKRDILSVNKSAISYLNPKFELNTQANILQLTRNANLTEAIDKTDEKDFANGIIATAEHQLRFFVNKIDVNGVKGYMILLIDATESLRAEEIRKDFSANVSHELKTPLTTIKGFGEMLENGIITAPEDIKKYGGTIYRESERLLQLINDIIRLSEIEEMSADDSVTNVNLLKTANDVCEILQPKVDSHGISLFVSGERFDISANQSYISELMLNLVDNSIKYNNPGGHVWIEIKKKGNNAVIKVKDDGIGISEKHQKRIFERFYRVDKSRSKQTGGTGLGLSIVKHIASYHHGSVNLESSSGEGTTVTVTIPIAQVGMI